MGECRQQKHTQHAPSTKTECDYLNGWIKKTVTYAKISPKSGEPQRYSWGTQKKTTKQTNKKTCYLTHLKPGRQIPALTLQPQTLGRAATGVSILSHAYYDSTWNRSTAKAGINLRCAAVTRSKHYRAIKTTVVVLA